MTALFLSTQASVQKVKPQIDFGPAPSVPTDAGFELIFRPDPTIWDGRFTNNGWLQELPKPISKLVWENAAFMSLATAERLGVADGGVVAITSQGRTIEAPALVSPGHAENTLTLHFGYGRSRTGASAREPVSTRSPSGPPPRRDSPSARR